MAYEQSARHRKRNRAPRPQAKEQWDIHARTIPEMD
jgi:hypothetical protein